MKRKRPAWRRFEIEAGARVLKQFVDHIATAQKASRTTRKRPDLFLRSKVDGSRVVVDFKHCAQARPEHIKQVSGYKGHPFYAQRGILVYPKDTEEFSPAFLEKAKRARVDVQRDRALRRSLIGYLIRALMRRL